MIHTVLIVTHAASGAVAFIAGCIAIRRPEFFWLYFAALIAMASTLALAVAEEWARIDGVNRVVFAGLIGLAIAMLWQGDKARRLDAADGTDVAVRRFQHMGFTLVSLFAAYVVIQVRGFDAPLWLVLGSVATASIAGHFVLDAVQARLFPEARAAASVRRRDSRAGSR